MQKSSVYHRLNNEFCGICSHQLKSARKQRSNLNKKDYQSISYIIAAQNNKDCVCFLCKQEPENIKSQLPVFITDEHGLKEIKVLLCTNTMGSSSHNKTLSCNAVTKGFSRPTSHPVQGWMGNNKAFCSHRTRDGRRVIKVYSIKWLCRGESWAFHSNK